MFRDYCLTPYASRDCHPPSSSQKQGSQFSGSPVSGSGAVVASGRRIFSGTGFPSPVTSIGTGVPAVSPVAGIATPSRADTTPSASYAGTTGVLVLPFV